MSIKSIEFENFRGQSKEYLFREGVNIIEGINGAGKSTIREAMAFVLCGTDSLATRNPQHLLTANTKGCKASVITDKAVITRTLTMAGNGTIKLSRVNGQSMTLTQTELETILGSTDLVLSVINPGYFINLPIDKKNKIISEILPINKDELFERLAVGIKLDDLEKQKYDYNKKRSNIVATAVAADRRMIENEYNKLTGELSGIDVTEPVMIDIDNSLSSLITIVEQDEKNLAKYETESQMNQKIIANITAVKERNEKKTARVKELTALLNTLQTIPRPDTPVLDEAKIIALRAGLKQLPALPSLGKVVDSPTCPTCGQTVGDKHKEMIQVENKRRQDEFDKESQAVREHNAKIEAEVKAINETFLKAKEQYLEVCKNNDKIQARKQSIEIEIASLQEEPVPELLEVKEPVVSFLKEERDSIKARYEVYRNAKILYEQAQRRYSENVQKADNIKTRLDKLSETIERYKIIERAVKSMPEEEMKLKTERFCFDDVRMVVCEDSVKFFKGNMPYELLSAGQKIKLDMQISAIINSLMKNPLNFMFVDNADLVDKLPDLTSFPKGNELQLFLAYVDSAIDNNEVYVNKRT